jgi:hypothetical protein
MDDHALETTLGRLLGPGRPELSCGECFEELDRYVEAEIARTDADTAVPGMRAHLEGCPACAEDHASLLTFTRAEWRLPETGATCDA